MTKRRYRVRRPAKSEPAVPDEVFLREWREHLGLNQEDVAEIIGCAQVTVSRWERWREEGGRIPNLTALRAFSGALKIGLKDLYRHPGRESADALLEGQPPEVVRHAIKLIKAIRQ